MDTNTAPMLDEYEMAARLKLSVHTLRKDRSGPRRIPYFRIGRAIRYSADTVMRELECLQEGGTTATKGAAA